jgi:hypothetical protein
MVPNKVTTIRVKINTPNNITGMKNSKTNKSFWGDILMLDILEEKYTKKENKRGKFLLFLIKIINNILKFYNKNKRFYRPVAMILIMPYVRQI